MGIKGITDKEYYMCVLDVIRGTIWLSCSKNEDWSSIRFKRIRRITEYPVVIIDRFNDVKQVRVLDRIN